MAWETPYIVYDVEIKKLIPQKDIDPDPRYQYCENWVDYTGMGLSMLGTVTQGTTIDYQSGWLEPADDGRQPGALKMIDIKGLDPAQPELAPVIMSFNGLAFDDKLMKALGLDRFVTQYDLYLEILYAAHGYPGKKGKKKGYKYNLGVMGEANGCPKNGDGAAAPILYQEGRLDELEQYCVNDCVIADHLFQLGRAGQLVDPNTGELLTLRSLDEALNVSYGDLKELCN